MMREMGQETVVVNRRVPTNYRKVRKGSKALFEGYCETPEQLLDRGAISEVENNVKKRAVAALYL